jgi:prepilin-type N-terminal cleavage/methylation domain-containing protein/prepilin-type processing-associated H-X9-DG protein
MTRTFRASRRSKGFTLIELLVVIGIIAVLIGILLPVLASARRAAASVKCLSNLKNLHNALLMYAGDYKNATPVGRQDDWNPVTRLAFSATANNRYWVDMLYPYVMRRSAPFPTFATKADADAYRGSVLWCPTWLADRPDLDPWTNYNDRFKNGYAMQIYFGFRPDYPNPDAMLPPNKQAMWSGVWNGGVEGKYYKRNEITDMGSRMVIADANLWHLGMSRTDAAGTLAGQIVDPASPPPGNVNGGSEHSASATLGGLNYDRYRHGKRPGGQNAGRFISSSGGKVAYNVLYLDGHAVTLNSIEDGYRAIRMRYP